jgi:hypothetical protein
VRTRTDTLNGGLPILTWKGPDEMESTDSAPTPPSTSTEPPPVASGASPDLLASRARLWACALVAGLVAGVVSWLGGEGCVELIKPPRHAVNAHGMTLRVTDRRGEAVAVARNAGLAFLILGAALGGGLGAAGGLARGSRPVAVRATWAGLVLGIVAAGAMSLALLPAYNAYQRRYPDEASRDLLLPLLVHAGIWSAVGAVGGLALALGLGGRSTIPRAVLGGFLGAAVGTVAYELAGALFPAARTAQFVSATWQTRLMARLAVTLLASAGAAMCVTSPPKPHAASGTSQSSRGSTIR